MLASIGVSRVADLFTDLPPALRLQEALALPPGLSEVELTRHLSALAHKNQRPRLSFLGAGAYEHFIPATVDAVISRGEFYTSYTPYQPEVSQGNLQAFYEYQTMICELTGMEVSNASLYDGASALAEAALMCSHITGKKRILLARNIHPEYREVVRTYAHAAGLTTVDLAYSPSSQPQSGRLCLESLEDLLETDDIAGVLVQSPNFFGSIEDLAAIGKLVHARGALLVVSVVEATSLGMLKPPGDFGADIVVGEGQSLGLPLNYGGPYLGIMACKQAYMRKMPGRIAGATVDANGRRGFVLTLQAREQHIRREAANSNVCSNQALCALAVSVYLATLGKEGLLQVAELSYQRAHYMYQSLLTRSCFKPVYEAPFYNEFVVRCHKPEQVREKLAEHQVVAGLWLDNLYPELQDSLLCCVTEMHTKDDIDSLINILR